MESKLILLIVAIGCIYVLFTQKGQSILSGIINKSGSNTGNNNSNMIIPNADGTNKDSAKNWIFTPKTTDN